MADASLQERLAKHAEAFDGLLSLIPAKIYYGEDTSDQWQRKKQSKQQAKAAKRGQLDPDSDLNRNAKEVMDERARSKRKLDDMQEEEEASSDAEDASSIDGVEKEKPGEGLKKKPTEDQSSTKKQKVSEGDQTNESRSKKDLAREERRLAKKQRKEEEKKKKKKGKAEKQAEQSEAEVPAPGDAPKAQDEHVQPTTEEPEEQQEGSDMAPIVVAGLVSKPDEDGSSDDASAPHSPTFDSRSDGKHDSTEPASTTTSISSEVARPEKPEKRKQLVIPKDTSVLRARLTAKIEALRAARKADGVDGKPIRTRQELIESRRAKQAQRKAHKQELRRLAKEEEDRKREEALSSARNSPGSILSPLIDLDNDRSSNHFAFGRVAFADGTQMSHDLSYEKNAERKKGPSDPKTALLKLEAQKKRIASLDEDKRKEVLEKETWLAARKRAEGEKVRDDETLLKKAVKRKEKAKKKSEKEWQERAQGVENSIKERQRKREENIRKRREEKLAHRSKGKKKGGASKKKSRPGFEGGGFGGKRK